jgi:hypothetical protein
MVVGFDKQINLKLHEKGSCIYGMHVLLVSLYVKRPQEEIELINVL